MEIPLFAHITDRNADGSLGDFCPICGHTILRGMFVPYPLDQDIANHVKSVKLSITTTFGPRYIRLHRWCLANMPERTENFINTFIVK